MKKFLGILSIMLMTIVMPLGVNAEELTSEYITITYAEHEVQTGSINLTVNKDIDLTNENAILEFTAYKCDKYLCVDDSAYTKSELQDISFTDENHKVIENRVIKANEKIFVGYTGGYYGGSYNAIMIKIVDSQGNGEEILVGVPLGDTQFNIVKINKISANSEESETPSIPEVKDEIVAIPEDKTTTKDMLEEIKENGNKVTYEQKENNKVLYSWTFDGSQMTSSDYDVDLQLTVGNSKNKETIESLLEDKEKSIVLEFAHHGELPKGTSVKVYVGDKYNDGDYVTLYYYNEETKALEEAVANIEVKDGYVEFGLEHCSEYVLNISTKPEVVETQEENKAPNNAQTGTMDVILYGMIASVSLLGIIGIVASKKKKVA